MATPAAPRSTSAASVACRSMGPGVVRLPASLSTAAPAGSNAPSVPMAPIGQSALNTWRARITDVVFPFVPVTPIICSSDELVAVEHRPAHGAEQHAALEPPRVGGEPGDGGDGTRARVSRIDQGAGARQRVHDLLQRTTHWWDWRTGSASANIVTVVPATACSPAAGQVW